MADEVGQTQLEQRVRKTAKALQSSHSRGRVTGAAYVHHVTLCVGCSRVLSAMPDFNYSNPLGLRITDN